MAENLHIPEGNRAEVYKALIPQIKSLLAGESDLIANMANFSAVLKQAFGFFWIGFYRVVENELVLGPFQGEIACTRISKGKGVCGGSWLQGKTLIVPNVNEFPGHIACSFKTKSEIVLPIFKAGKIIAVLDVDSKNLNDFSEVDKKYLEKMLTFL